MGTPVTIDSDLLRAAEEVTHIHDPARLVEEGLRLLCSTATRTTFDFDTTLRAADALPDLDAPDFEDLSREINARLPPSW